MDLIGALAGQLGIDTNQAEAVAGAVLGSVRADAPATETAALEAAVPEMGDWEAKAKAMLADNTELSANEGDGGFFGNLLSSAGSGIGNQILGAVAGKEAAEKAAAVGLLGKLGLQPSHAALAAPLVLSFLESRLPEGTMSSLLKVAPMLVGLSAAKEEAPAAAGAMDAMKGALGGLFGND